MKLGESALTNLATLLDFLPMKLAEKKISLKLVIILRKLLTAPSLPSAKLNLAKTLPVLPVVAFLILYQGLDKTALWLEI
ncbi:MAG: hypothetical protein A2Z88_07370 [Omnitrophica WOR_2 bacterium GWA2_47_8]|nr:MAG: hypothetical protein A2Z88_07370 [Omnitrophica WOR_2 bacterium GWA2_47_8]